MSDDQSSDASSDSHAKSEDTSVIIERNSNKEETISRSQHSKESNGYTMQTRVELDSNRSVKRFEETAKTKNIHRMRASSTKKQSDANLIIHVLGDTQTGNESNAFKQVLQTSLADSRGFRSKEETLEFLKMTCSRINANEKTFVLGEAAWGGILTPQDPEENNNMDSTTSYFLSVIDETEPENKYMQYEKERPISDVSRTIQEGKGKGKDVVFVIGGDVSVLKTVHYAVTHGIPVVVMRGSGSVADLIAAGHNRPLTDKFVDRMQDFMKNEEIPLTKDKDEIDQCVHMLLEILAKDNYVNIYNKLDRTDIQDIILLALKKAHPNNLHTHLSLAWMWDKVDFARNEILFKDPMFAEDEVKCVEPKQLYATLFATLANDQADFVKLLLRKELKVDITEFLQIHALQELYKYVLDHNSVNDTMTNFIKNQLPWTQEPTIVCTSKDDPQTIGNIGLEHSKSDVVANIRWNNADTVNGYTNRKYQRSTPCDLDSDNNVSHEGNLDLIKKVGKLIGAKIKDDMCNPYLVEPAEKRSIKFIDLFLFAILFNRQQIGEIMWRNCQDKLGAALVASSILKAFAKSAKRSLELELSTDLLNHASDYEQKAVGVLTECYNQDKKRAHDLLIRKLEEPFHSITPLALADSNYLKEFMGHPCCQTKLKIIWRGKIAVHTPWWKILLSLFMPILIFIVKFTTCQRAFTVKKFCGKFQKRNKVGLVKQKNELDCYVTKSDSSKPKWYTVGLRCDEIKGVIQIFDAMYYLYSAPFSVYTLNMLSYVIFMAYFSYFIIVDLNEATSIKEYTIWGWSFTMFVEEMRQLKTNRQPKLVDRMQVWLGSHWNKYDLLINSTFITTVVLRYSLSGNDFQYVRFLYSVTVALYFMRFLQAFLVAQSIGPKVIMIRKMMVDLLSFLGIFLVFFVSFSVMYQANLYPNSPPNASLLKKIVYKPYWQIFGELFLDEMSGDPYGECTKNESVWRSAGGEDRCPEDTRLVIFIGAVYFILTHIVLVNLLIAMFSYTFQRVQEKSGHIWKFYWYGIVREYYERPVLCPPLIILVHIYRTLRHWVKKIYHGITDNEFRLKDKTGLYSETLTKFVDAATERYRQQNLNAKQ